MLQRLAETCAAENALPLSFFPAVATPRVPVVTLTSAKDCRFVSPDSSTRLLLLGSSSAILLSCSLVSPVSAARPAPLQASLAELPLLMLPLLLTALAISSATVTACNCWQGSAGHVLQRQFLQLLCEVSCVKLQAGQFGSWLGLHLHRQPACAVAVL